MSQEEPIDPDKLEAMTKAYEKHFGIKPTHKPAPNESGYERYGGKT